MNLLMRLLSPLRQSLRLRILVLVLVIVLGTVVLMALYTLRRFEEASIFQLEHEALVLSDVLRAAVAPALLGTPDVHALQADIDRIVASREKNDIEINIMLLRGSRSAIVASNIPDNIEKTDIYEHRDLLASLQQGTAIMFIGRDEDSPLEPPASPASPDYYILPGNRFISMTTPLVIEGRKLGSINTKLSLAQIDQQLNRIHNGILLMGFLLPLVALLLVFGAIQRGLRPLNRLGSEVAGIESSSLSYRFSSGAMPLELQPIVSRLNDLLERLEAAFERERRFTASVAHELRTPIATLKTLAEVGIQGQAGSSRHQEALPFYQDALVVARQMEQLVVSLLGLVRCESGLQKVTLSPVDLQDLVQSAWETFQDQARAKHVYCQFTLTDEAQVHSDSTLLEAILRNLFSNAATHTPRNGSVLCSLEREGGCFLLAVTNTHQDLRGEDLEHLFEPFWRKDTSRSDASHCGIGLSLVAAYSKRIGIAVKTELPSADLFRITLRIPLHPELD